MSTQSTVSIRGFVAVQGRRGAPILARWCRGVVWARRVLPGGAGWHPAPACLFFPFPSGAAASQFADRVGAGLGWPCVVTRGSGGSAVWGAVNAWVPPFVCKVRLPGGLPARQARALLDPFCPGLSVLV
jgi:hypothetical protein